MMRVVPRPHVSPDTTARYLAWMAAVIGLSALAIEHYWPLLPAILIVIAAIQAVRPHWLWGSKQHELDEFFSWLARRSIQRVKGDR